MKKILLISSLILFAITFTGCFNSIFYEINRDVSPAELTVKGVVRTIVRYTVEGKEYLVTLSDDGIKYKPVDTTSNKYSSHGCWKNYSVLPEDYTEHIYEYFDETHNGQQLLKIIGDSEYLYLITCTYKKDIEEGSAVPDKVNLYVTKITTLSDDEITWTDSKWEKVPDASELFLIFKPSKADCTFSAFNIFSTNSVQTAHRKAYLRSGGYLNYTSYSFSDEETAAYTNPVYYELNGTELTPISITSYDIDDYKDGSTAKNNQKKYGCNSAVWINNEVLFFNSTASVTNETYTTDASIVYYGVSNNLYYSLASDLNTHIITFSPGTSPISCLAVCSDSLLIGRGDIHATTVSASGGITKTVLVDGLPKKDSSGEYEGTISFTTNAEIKLKTSYFILTLLTEDPSKKELESNIFSSINFIGSGTSSTATFSNVGLWSYYPERGNWNCE